MADMEIKLPCFGIVVTLVPGPKQTWSPKRPLMLGGSITSDLHEHGSIHCQCDACDQCHYNHLMDGIEALILGHACARIDITTPAYLSGIEAAVEGAANNL
jgi:hypothetical protein